MAKYENIDGLLFRDGATFTQAWNNHHGNILTNELNNLQSKNAIALEVVYKQSLKIQELEAELEKTKYLYQQALRHVPESLTYEPRDETSAPDYAGVEKCTGCGGVGEVLQLQDFDSDPIVPCPICNAQATLNLAADDDTVDMEADSERYVVEELEAPEGVSGKWYGVRNTYINKIVYTNNQHCKVEEKANRWNREHEQANVEADSEGASAQDKLSDFADWYHDMKNSGD